MIIHLEMTYGPDVEWNCSEQAPPQVTERFRADVKLSNGHHHVVLSLNHNYIP